MGCKSLAHDASQSLLALSNVLAQQNGTTETGFFQLGDMLRELHSDANGLTQSVRERADNLRRAVDQNRVSGTDGLAARSLAELRAILAETSQLMVSLREVGAALQKLQKEIQGIQRISMFLRVSVIGFAVESARSPKCQEAFAAFVSELRSLSEQVEDIGNRISDELKSTELAQARRLDAMGVDFEKVRSLADRLEHTWDDTATEVQQFFDASVAAVQETEERAQKISRHADEAVYYMQFGDIVRQKSEHVIASLQETAGALESASSARDARVKCAAAARVVAIQISQLKLIQQEVLGAHSKLAADLHGIASEKDLMAGSLGNQATAKGCAGDHPIVRLSANAHQVEVLRAQGHELGLDARKTARETAEASARLAHFLDQVKGINRDMHLQALNAIVKTALLEKEGATLEVLSMEVDRLFRESNREVEKIVETLKSMLMVTDGYASSSASPAAVLAADVDTGLRGGLERIKQACEQFRDLAERARPSGQEQNSWLSSSNSKLEFLNRLASALGQDLEVLQDIQQMLQENASAEHAHSHALIGQSRYTMQSERDVHQSVLGAASAAKVAALPELDQSGPLQTPEFQLVPPAADPQASPPGPTSSEAGKAPAFGDNVELF